MEDAKRENLFNAIKEAIEDMSQDHKAALWNEYCDKVNNYDGRIEYMDQLPELFDNSNSDGLFNLLNRFYFGHDENDESSSANPNRDYFYFNGYGNIITTDYPGDVMDIEDLIDYIIDNNDPLYDDDIEEVLNGINENDEGDNE